MSTSSTLKGVSSIALHTASQSLPEHAHLNPIFATSTFTFDTADEGMQRFAGEAPGYIYSRWGNPSFTPVELTIAALEAQGILNDNGTPLELKALLHASGQAAMSTLFLSNLQSGDAVLSHYSLYGGTHEILHKVLHDAGVTTIIVDMQQPALVAAALEQHPNIKLIHIETPANPTIQCIDIAAVAAIAQQYGVKVSVDNTFATPYLQQPFKYKGVDFVFHSTTKFLNGHGTAMGGILIGKDLDFMATKATKWHRLLGGNSNPFDAFLLHQGLKTLELRMERHCSNAEQVAAFLAQHPQVVQVNYNGLPSHSGYAISQQQMKHPGAMLSFELAGGLPQGKQFIDKLRMLTKAVSLGTLDTLVSHPASMTHYGVPREERLKYGITDGLIRMSVGIENIEDIIADIAQALK
ncbi:MAG TPA: cystathionine gamma-synthase [Chitinophagaceae bacterium]|nr:cystathionine gamma-synthase [Chitinophagaceae bacterium]